MSRIARRLAGIGASDLVDAAAFDAYVGPAREITVDPIRNIIALHDGETPGGKRTIQLVVGGSGISVDATDPVNPIITSTSIDFDLVLDLLADDNDEIGYAGSGAKRIVAPGYRLTAQGSRYEVATSGAMDWHVETAGGVKLYVLPNPDNSITERQFGAPCDGSFDDNGAGIDATVILQKWMNHPSKAIRRFTGVSRVTDGITFPPGVTIEGVGHSSGLNAAGGLATKTYVLSRTGTLVAMPGLASNATKGANSFALTDASGVNAGDILRIRNPVSGSWSAWRPDYSAGEFVQVLRKSGNTIYITNPLYDSYAAADVVIDKLDPETCAQVILRDFRIKQPATDYKDAIHVRNNVGTTIKNVYCSGSEHAGIMLDTCVKIDVDTNLDGAYDATADNEYGLSINSCQWGAIRGCLTAQRHAIAQGTFTGNVPNRALLIMSPNLGNNFATAANDIGHAGNEDITFMGGTYAGGSVGGKNCRYVGVHFRKANDGIALYMGEVIEGDFTFDGCTFESFVNPNSPGSYGALELGKFTANVTGKARVFLNNCHFRFHPSTVYGIRLHLNGVLAANAPELYVNGGHVEGAGLTQFIRLVRSSGDFNVDVISVKDVRGLPSGCQYAANAGSLTVGEYILPRQRGRATITPASTSISQQTTTITFRHPYPIAPEVLLTLRDNTIGGTRSILTANGGLSATGVTINAITASGGNFVSVASGTVSWEAELATQ